MSKKRLSFIIVIALFALIMTGCQLLSISDHICEYSYWVVVKEATCKEQGIKERYCLICDKTDSEYIAKVDHSPTKFEGKDPGCTEEGKTSGVYCSVCMKIISGIDSIDPIGHNVVIDAAVEPTTNSPGRTEGTHCSNCGEIFVKQTSIFFGDYNNHERYNDDYSYMALLQLENGSAMGDFYEEIDAYASVFHISLEDAKHKKNGETDIYFMAEICYSDNGLTSEQALTAWTAYIKDHPIYYWMATNATYTSDYLTVIVDPNYISGEVRESTNYQIYLKVEEYIEYLDGETNAYYITLGLHDLIISNTDYAYEPDGVTPSYDENAHTIIGALLEGEGVCESYAKTFQMILNYYGIDNVIVTGHSGVPHAWNLVQLDDGNWYWYDLTWDDQPDWTTGIRHNYFCISNSEYVAWSDGSSSKNTLFLEDHIPDAPGGMGVHFSYALPDASDTPYNHDGLMIRNDIIEQNGLSYTLIGYKSLALIEIRAEGNVVIPEIVVYDGEEYNVILIGKFDRDLGVFTAGSIIPFDTSTRDHIDVTNIFIPKSICFIWDYSFDYCNTIERFDVDEDNPTFTSVDGVLFTKSLYTLIKYPLAKTNTTYTVPKETVEIAFGAFGDGGNVFCPKHLIRLTITKNVDVIGAVNAGRGFRDATPDSPADIFKIDGYLARLYTMLGIAGVRVE